MDSDSSDLIIGPSKKRRVAAPSGDMAAKAPPGRGPYLKRFEALLHDGPAVVVAVVSHPQGRYHDFFAHPSRADEKQFVLSLSPDVNLRELAAGDAAKGVLLGFVVVSAWRLVQPLESHSLAFSDDKGDKKHILMHKLATHCVKGSRCIVQHPVLAAAETPGYSVTVPVDLMDPLSLSTVPVLSALLESDEALLVQPYSLQGHIMDGSKVMPLPELLADWIHHYGMAREPHGTVPQPLVPHVWVLCPEIALPLVRGRLPCECGAVGPRSMDALLPPVLEQQKLLQSLLKSAVELPHLHFSQSSLRTSESTSATSRPTSTTSQPRHDTSSKARQLGSMQGYSCRHLVLAVQATKHISALGRLELALSTLLKFGCATDSPYQAGQVSELQSSNFQVPSRFTLARARVRLDITCSLLTRQINEVVKPVIRQLNFDASPQGGLELLGCKELTLRCAGDMTKLQCARPSSTVSWSWSLWGCGQGSMHRECCLVGGWPGDAPGPSLLELCLRLSH